MPVYTIGPYEIELSRLATIIDTNVLNAAFLPEDQRHGHANVVLENIADEGQIVVPVTVIVEAWGWLVGSRKRWDCGLNMISWLSDPNNVTIITQPNDRNRDVFATMLALQRIDCVDVYLCFLADEISNKCSYNPPIRVATYDPDDISNIRYRYGLKVSVHDLRSNEIY